MAGGQRAYIKDSKGRFAGSKAGGTRVVMGRAGGFANAGFRARVAGQRKAGGTGAKGSSKGRSKGFLSPRTKAKIKGRAKFAVIATAGVAGGAAAGAVLGRAIGGAARNVKASKGPLNDGSHGTPRIVGGIKADFNPRVGGSPSLGKYPSVSNGLATAAKSAAAVRVSPSTISPRGQRAARAQLGRGGRGNLTQRLKNPAGRKIKR